MTGHKRQKASFRRTRILISRRFQLRYAVTILLMMVFTAAICSYTVYYTGMIALAERISTVIPQGRLVAMINMVNYRILGNIALLAPVVILLGIYLSHKIAGPIYRMERHINEMAAGNFSSHITLREGDELGGFANKINRLSDSLRITVLNQKVSLDKIALELEMIRSIAACKPGQTPRIDEAVERLDTEVRVLTKEIEKYKV